MSQGSCEAGVPDPSRRSVSARALVERYFDMWNEGQGAVADEVLAPTYVDHDHPDVLGPAATRALVPRFRRADVDAHFEAEIVAAGDEFVVARRTVRMLRGGEPVETHGIVVFRVADGKLAEQWSWPENRAH